MAEESGIYTREQLEELDNKINYMIHGQGFAVCVVDTKHTRRRTHVNILKKLGVENIVEADSYDKVVAAVKEYSNEKILILTNFEVGKTNGLRIITSLMTENKDLCGIILTETRNPKLEQIIKVTKAIKTKIMPLSLEDLKEIILDFGYKIEKP